MKTKLLILGVLFGLISLTGYSQDDKNTDYKFPDYVGFVNDCEEIFTQDQIKELNDIISKHEKQTTNEIAILTITSFEPYETLFDYSLDLADYWRIGNKDKNNGVAIVFGQKIRQIRIQVGYGLENKLKDEEASIIIEKIIIPEFKKGDFYAGIKNGLIAIINEIE